MNTKRNRRKRFFTIFGIILILFVMLLYYIFIGWKIPIAAQIESLHLPENCEMIYPTKIWVSDVYWWHIKGEKVVKCDMDYKAAEEYIIAHNSPKALAYIDIYPYGGMSDISIYNSEFDEEFLKQPDWENYITISYFRKIGLLHE
ncbi:MAG: hypothetical protein NC321_15890 [Clostridium sp.]|nr:hypothetical protein [Clostridium sp.]